MDKLKDIVLNILKAIDWRSQLYKAYVDSVKPELQKLVVSTESTWDDVALNAVDLLIEKFLKPNA